MNITLLKQLLTKPTEDKLNSKLDSSLGQEAVNADEFAALMEQLQNSEGESEVEVLKEELQAISSGKTGRSPAIVMDDFEPAIEIELPQEIKQKIESAETDIDLKEAIHKILSKNVKSEKQEALLEKAELPDTAKQLKTEAKKTQADMVKNTLDFNEFMAKQSPAVQKRMALHSYGNHQEKKIFENKFENKISPVVLARPEMAELKVEESSLGEKNDGQENLGHTVQDIRIPQVSAKSSTTPVFDLNKLTSTDVPKVIEEIQNYIIQSRVSGEQKVELSFHHQDLGKVDLMVEKAGKDALNIRIQTQGSEAASFFAKNQGELLQSLNNAGVQVANLKLESGQTNNTTAQNFSGSGQEGASSQQGQQASQHGQRQQDSDRRAELWKILQDRMAA